MAAKTKSRPPSTFPDLEPINELLRTPPTNTEERLVHIRALGQRVKGYVQFMCAVQKMNGTCAEAKQRSVAQFYDRLVLLDRELCRIQEELQLG